MMLHFDPILCLIFQESNQWELFFSLFLALSIGHALGDFPLQGSYLALTKNPENKEFEAGETKYGWVFSLIAHCLIHAGIVWFITSSVLFGLIELVLHSMIDYSKMKFKFSYETDQIAHYFCKLIYAVPLSFYI